MKHAIVVLLGGILFGSTGCIAHRPMKITLDAAGTAQLAPKAGDIVGLRSV